VRDVARFAPIASLALSEAIEAEGLTVEIKWPHDVVADGRKLGGALLEVATCEDSVSYVILGLGVNLNVSRAELEAELGAEAAFATSVSELAGRAIDRNRFAARLCNRLEKWHWIVGGKGREATLAAWQTRDALRGRPLAVGSGADAWCGFGRGVDASGCLLVEDAAGRQHRVVSGAVRLLQPTRDPGI
jgi:BirA family biotin operon repressor/biotin-[acetyl-CoA-carboxylase] ligase